MMSGMSAAGKAAVFDPHLNARAEALAGRPLATFPQRAAAFLIDFVIVIVTYAPVETLRQYLVARYIHHQQHVGRLAVEFNFHHTGNVVWLVLYFGLVVWLTNGLTVGKRLLGIRIVSLSHARMTLWQAVERALGYVASTLEAGFGFLQIFFHHNRCCVHDRIAETIVVKDRGQ
jgi:uncharacterized RDD family membrane protein YckC